MPILRGDGAFFGTLCALDPKPAKLNNPATIGMFKLFAELIAAHLDAGERLASAEASLSDERRLAELRDQFVAVLGHDLRNPIAALDAGTKLLLRTSLDEKARRIVTAMQGSVSRMADLVNNVMDFARGRLGGGFAVKLTRDQPLEPVLRQVIAELQTVEPERDIEADFDIAHPVACDRARVAQLLSNLLGNALTHGRADAPVWVSAITRPDTFELSVSNTGDAIPPDLMENLFRPFFRGEGGHSREGLGLGLYIACEIAKAHGGTLEAKSSEEETRFTFRMPLSGRDEYGLRVASSGQ
jgi:signal transduction histidine kinase